MNDSIVARCIHATAASAASTSSRMIQPTPEPFGWRTAAWTTGGGLASLRTSRIAPTDLTSAAIVTADS